MPGNKGVVVGVLALGSLFSVVTIVAASCSDRSSEGEAATSAVTEPTATTDSITPIERTSPFPVVFYAHTRNGHLTRLPKSVRTIPLARNFQASPDGARLAFIGPHSRIYVANVDGSHARAVAPAGFESALSWSPDGKNLAYSVGGQIRVLDVSSGEIVPVLKGTRKVFHPNFSADGERILFTREDAKHVTLWTIPVRGGSAARLFTRSSRSAFGTYSPDGTAIAFRRTLYDGRDPLKMTSTGLWVADANGDNPRRLVGGSVWTSQIKPEALWPVWSPDGTQIAYETRYGSGVTVLNVRTGQDSAFGSGTEPSWLDNNTLILEALR